MKIRFNVTGERRKALAKAIAEILGEDFRYLGVPTFAYAFDYYIIERDGTLVCDDRTNEQEIGSLVAGLAERGFEASVAAAPAHEEDEEAEPQEKAEDEPAPAPQQEAEDEQPPGEPEAKGSEVGMEKVSGLTVSMSGEGFDETARQNLMNLVESKAGLIKKALGVDDLPMEFTPEKVSFPWFARLPEADEANAYMEFISSLCKAAKAQKRVTAKEREVANEKYAFRCFLLRLGFIGAEYKTARKILLRNLPGNGAFRDGKRKEADGDAVSE